MRIRKIIYCICLSGFCIIYVSPAKSQNENVNPDSLSKYSYTIFGLIKHNPRLDMGTCSFLKKDGGLFLLTAKQVLYDCDSITNRPTAKFEVASVFLPNNIDFIQFIIPIIIDSCVIDYKDPDLFVLKIDNKWIDKVNSIELISCS